MHGSQAQVLDEDYFAPIAEHAAEYSAKPATDCLLTTGSALDSWKYAYLKRAFDTSLASIMLLLFAIPGFLIAAIILITSRGPVFYREERIGRYGRPFRIWKFRSMHRHITREALLEGAQAVPSEMAFRTRKNHHDPRITVVGRHLRRWSLDEIPQILNVLRGEMSIIGPRPIVKEETAFYDALLPFYLAAVPGLTGLWQVSGRCNVDYPRRAELDASYVLKWSLRSDCLIFMRTIPAVLKRTGAR